MIKICQVYMNCINFKENTWSEAFSKHNLVPFVATLHTLFVPVHVD